MKYNKKLPVLLLILFLIVFIYYNNWQRNQFEIVLLEMQVFKTSQNLIIPFQFFSRKEAVYKINFYVVDKKNKINFYPEYIVFAKKNKTHILKSQKEIKFLKNLGKNCRFYFVLEEILPSYKKFNKKVISKQRDKILEILKNS